MLGCKLVSVMSTVLPEDFLSRLDLRTIVLKPRVSISDSHRHQQPGKLQITT
jgi:hypothetical protein